MKELIIQLMIMMLCYLPPGIVPKGLSLKLGGGLVSLQAGEGYEFVPIATYEARAIREAARKAAAEAARLLEANKQSPTSAAPQIQRARSPISSAQLKRGETISSSSAGSPSLRQSGPALLPCK